MLSSLSIISLMSLGLVPSTHRVPPRVAPIILTAVTPVPDASRASDDWAGLPGAIQASKCGAINYQILKFKEFNALLDYVSSKQTELNAVNVATAIHRLAQQTKRDRAGRDKLLRDPRFVKLLDATSERASQCNPRSVSDIMWGCATLQHWPPVMLKPMLTQIAVHLKSASFEAQHLSLVVWALAVLQCKPTVLLDQIELQAIKQLSDFNMQNCANIAWGFANLNYKASGQLLPAVKNAILKPGLLSDSKPVEVSDFAYAVAVLGDAERDGAVMQQLAARAAPGQLLDSFTSRQLVTMLWSFARLKIAPQDELLERWLEVLKASHGTRPLLEQDERNLRRALAVLGESTAWLDVQQEEATSP